MQRLLSLQIILETVVESDKVMQDFESESIAMGVDHSQKVKATPITIDYGSKDCVNLSLSTAVFRMMVLILLCGCQSRMSEIDPKIDYTLSTPAIKCLPSAFPALDIEEYKQSWAKELYLGNAFAREGDLYRAISCYKRALFLLPPQYVERRLQIEFEILQSYYLGKKFSDVITIYEEKGLREVSECFPAKQDLLIMVYEAYQASNRCEEAQRILEKLQTLHPEKGQQLQQYEAVQNVHLATLSKMSEASASFVDSYVRCAKSESKAKTLNALLPGAGYLYMGQQQTALTAFIVNALFVAAAYHFFNHGNIAAGIITSSLEFGWYYGGIHGAGQAAKIYNEMVYENLARDYLQQNRLFPSLMLRYAF